MTIYSSLNDIFVDAAEVLSPPTSTRVSQAAEESRYLHIPGSYTGGWKNKTVPYMVEPMDELTSRLFRAVIFCGPAQCGKTDALLLNWWLYNVLYDGADQLFVETSQSTARRFSRQRIDRVHRDSKRVGEKLLRGGNNDNTYDKYYRNGAVGRITWPSINELSGIPVGRVALTDYDRMDQDIDGEGSPFELASKRTTTFGSSAMTLVESSPGFIITDPRWSPKTPHEAPTTKGILSLYNLGDRRRWYWKCWWCEKAFEPTFDKLSYNAEETDTVAAAEAAFMACPHCDKAIDPSLKQKLNESGVWLKDGERWDSAEQQKVGDPARSEIASFWLMGVAASFSSWKTLVSKYLDANAVYERTGSEENLKATINTDQGLPYTPKSLANSRRPEDIQSRARDIGDRMVPEGVRFLLAVIDVQGNRFEVQITGHMPFQDRAVVDYFTIRKSKRLDEDGDRLAVSPGTHLEDWDLLIEKVVNRTYPIADDSGRFMRVKYTLCDSGGRAGVTEKAYNFWRAIKKKGMANRFQLLKGEHKPSAPRVETRYPDSQRKDRHANARGEIPIVFINTNIFKDALDKDLRRDEPGGGYIIFPDWLHDEYYEGLCVEERTEKGWRNLRKLPNEPFDLLSYDRAAFVKVGGEQINWESPPSWAQEWDSNSLVSKTDKPAFSSISASEYSMEAIAEDSV
ncbi:MAG: phage terminase large subunit family protein [Agarilytica sp.]